MGFLKGIHCPHPPRGRARKPYKMSEAARRQRRSNLKRTRVRSDRETATIKLLIWQACFESEPRPSQRELARRVGVWPSYVCKVQKQAARGMDFLVQQEHRVTLDDLAEARRFTARLQDAEPDLLAPARAVAQSARPSEPRAMTVDEAVAERWREVQEWKCNNPPRRRRVLFSVTVR